MLLVYKPPVSYLVDDLLKIRVSLGDCHAKLLLKTCKIDWVVLIFYLLI